MIKKMKKLMTILRERSNPVAESVSHPDFLGAHRYTTGGGTARSAEGWLSATQPRGDAALPLRCARHTYPYVYFALGKALKSRASPGTRFGILVRLFRVLPHRSKARCRHGS